MPDDLHYLSLDEVARRLKARKLSSVDATRSILGRIEKLDPGLRAYATVTAERALADHASAAHTTAPERRRHLAHCGNGLGRSQTL